MDFLDPKKQRRHTILLYTGYVLIAIAILISTVVLVYQANGFGVNSKGQVVQNGLVFFSSQPNPATIRLNGKLSASQTNDRLSLPGGNYNVLLGREGYRSWQRSITVQGGDVQHFDYPFLFPTNLATTNQATYSAAPGLATQSRDHRWLLVQQSPTSLVFDIYDLKNPDQAAVPLTIPATILRSTTGQQSWELVQWADDNKHLVLKHSYATGNEFIEVDRSDSTKPVVNLNTTLASEPTVLTLIDNKYDQYHVFNATSGELSTASLGEPTPVKVLSNVVNYKSYGSRTILYATTDGAASGKVAIAIVTANGQPQIIRQVAAGSTYLLDMAGYQGVPYAVIGAASENNLYIYRDPVGQLKDDTLSAPVALRALRITNPTYVSFSPGTQYIVAENANQFTLFDVYLKHGYAYTLAHVFDAPQQHASWMDGNRLTYVSGGKLLVFDYDRRNPQVLMAANPGSLPFFSPDYHYVYTMAPATIGSQLTKTGLLTSADL